MKKMLYILIFIMSCSFCISSYPGICELEIEVNEEYKSHVISSFGLKKTTYLRYALMPESYHMLYCLLAIELAYPGVERAQYIESLNRENIIYNVCATSDESILQLAFSLNIYLYLYHDPIDRAEIIYRYQGNTVHAEVDLSMTNKSLSKYGTEIYDELERIMLSPVQDAPEVTDSAVLTALSASPYDRLYQTKDNIDEYELLFLQMLCINCACQGMTRNQIKQLLESFPAFRDNIWINNVSISVDIEPYSLFFVTNYEDQITHASLSVMPERWLYTEEAQQEGYFLLPTFYILMDDTYMTNSLQ